MKWVSTSPLDCTQLERQQFLKIGVAFLEGGVVYCEQGLLFGCVDEGPSKP